MAHTDRAIVNEKASRVRLLATDVDGVLTDGTLLYSASGEELKAFHVRDGLGLRLLEEAGIPAVLLTARSGRALERRAEELGLELLQGVGDKASALVSLLRRKGIGLEEVCYIGDDWVDLPVLLQVGLGVAVADAAPPLQDYAHYVTRAPGGRGAVREVAELILKAKGLWGRFLNRYITGEE